MPGSPGTGFAGKAPCGASPASTVRGSTRGKRRIHGAKERANAPVGAGLARHGVRRECPHAGQAPHLRCPAPRAASAAFTRYESGHAPRRCRACPARGSPGRPHAGQAPHLRNARFPAWQAPHSRDMKAVNRPRRCRARPARGFTGKAPCGAFPASTKCAAPCARQAPHSRAKRAGKRPRRCRAFPARASPGMPPCGASPASTKCGPLRESPASMGNTLFRGVVCRHGCLAGTASTRARGRSTGNAPQHGARGVAPVRRCPAGGQRTVASCPPDTAIRKAIRRRSQLRRRAGALHFAAQNY